MLKWNKVKNLNTANDKEFCYIIEVFVDYRLSTVQLKKKKKSKSCTCIETLTVNDRNRFES